MCVVQIAIANGMQKAAVRRGDRGHAGVSKQRRKWRKLWNVDDLEELTDSLRWETRGAAETERLKEQYPDSYELYLARKVLKRMTE